MERSRSAHGLERRRKREFRVRRRGSAAYEDGKRHNDEFHVQPAQTLPSSLDVRTTALGCISIGRDSIVLDCSGS